MQAEELCEAVAGRLAELRIGSLIPAGEKNVLFVQSPGPCLIVCRGRVSRQSRQLMNHRIPVLLVHRKRDIERVAQLLSYATADSTVSLVLSGLAMWRAA